MGALSSNTCNEEVTGDIRELFKVSDIFLKQFKSLRLKSSHSNWSKVSVHRATTEVQHLVAWHWSNTVLSVP